MPVAAVGDTAQASLSVTDETIETFAAVTGDENPLHLDADYAADGVFGERVAHGMLGASLISAALADLPGDIVYVSQDLSFEAPVRLDDTLRAEVEVLEIESGDRVTVDTTALTEAPVITGEASVLSLAHPTPE